MNPPTTKIDQPQVHASPSPSPAPASNATAVISTAAINTAAINTAAINKDARRRTLWKWVIRLAILMLALLVGAELVGRFVFGFGNPPLYVADSKIEYLFRADQDMRRFGRHIHFNHWSMRADDFALHKTDRRELRVMVIGDSVINGGAMTDQSDLATTILQRELAAKLGRPVVVGNASAPSWGPANELEYGRRFGFFDADVIVIVLNSNDSFDVPTYQPIVGRRPDYPARRPWLALQEVLVRYVLPRLRYGTGTMQEAPSLDVPAKPSDVDDALRSLRDLIELARGSGARVIVAQHLERAEARGQPKFGHDQIAAIARDSGAQVVQLGPAFRDALAAGRDPYQPMPNIVHPNELGQRLIAEQLMDPILAAAATPATQPAK